MVCISKICLFLINFLKNMIEVRLGTNWYVLRIILLELSRQNFLSPVTVPPKITVRELHCGLQPSDLVSCCRAPSRHHTHRPDNVQLCSLDFVPCRRHSSLAVMLSLKVVSTLQRILLIPLLPSLCRHNFVKFTSVAFRRLSAATMRSLSLYKCFWLHIAQQRLLNKLDW